MAGLKKELYGGFVGSEDGKLSTDPEWADVEPVVLQEPEGALAAIAYPDDYAEGEFPPLVSVTLSGFSVMGGKDKRTDY